MSASLACPSSHLAVVTGASCGIGRELALCCARHHFDLIVAADEPAIEEAAAVFRAEGVQVEAVQADLAERDGVDRLWNAIGGRRVDALLANAGQGLGHAFLEQDFDQVRHVINTHLVGTIDLVQRVVRDMRSHGTGHILFTGSIAGLVPGTSEAIYNGTKAFVDSFSLALRDELKDTGITVSCLMPDATDTPFFVHAEPTHEPVGQSAVA
jgi:short-subunit dehydrogenase